MMMRTATTFTTKAMTPGSENDVSCVDEKYLKRRNQKKGERLRQGLIYFAAALLLLMYTWNTLARDFPEGEGLDGSEAFRTKKGVPPPGRREGRSRGADGQPRRRGQPPPQQQPKPQPQQQQQGLQSLGGVGGFLGMFFQDEKFLALEQELEDLEQRVVQNTNAGIRWANPDVLPPLHPQEDRPLVNLDIRTNKRGKKYPKRFFSVQRLLNRNPMAWESESRTIDIDKGPRIDFTKQFYDYPEKLYELPALGEYPQLVPMRELMETWPQDDIDHPPSPIKERLIHFDFTNPRDLEAARKFRDAKLPFKLINVPEVLAAGEKWTDEYVAANFDGGPNARNFNLGPRANGNCQESPDNFFAFFVQGGWPVEAMGIPPTRNNDLTYSKWAQHAKFADATSLHPHQPHFYWQAGVDKEERYMTPDRWTFISRDLPSFSSATETFFLFEPESQKGIQCRFGERGVTAATHFDAGRNMVAMISGAKRYILSPPKECTKLGIVTKRGNPVFRHSLLNFGHLNEMDNPDMPAAEREWLERSGDAMAVDTVLKAGEVLYIPSFWFHYITSLQKSAQCNVRSGIDAEGDSYFGGQAEVTNLCQGY